jgi:hypothetical protein
MNRVQFLKMINKCATKYADDAENSDQEFWMTVATTPEQAAADFGAWLMSLSEHNPREVQRFVDFD